MAESTEDRPKYFTLAVMGIVSLIVGVCSGLLITYLTEKRLGLIYEVTTLEVFPGKTQNIGIIAIRVSNSGRKEIEDLQCQIELRDAKLTEPRTKGLPPSAITLSHTAEAINAKVPFFNPTESFSLQLLVKPSGDEVSEPKIDIRGKGVVGTEKSAETPEGKTKSPFEAIASALGAVGAGLATMLILRRRGGALFSGPEQRDEFAYLLGLNGFLNEVTELRASSRNHKYWALADAFTEQMLASRDSNHWQRAANVLEQLLEYSGDTMASSSKAIIQLNIARLALASGNTSKATDLVRQVNKSNHTVVRTRVKLDNALRPLLADSKRENAG